MQYCLIIASNLNRTIRIERIDFILRSLTTTALIITTLCPPAMFILIEYTLIINHSYFPIRSRSIYVNLITGCIFGGAASHGTLCILATTQCAIFYSVSGSQLARILRFDSSNICKNLCLK